MVLGLYYAMLPPEINSTRMYAGPGASSLQAAATTWGQLSADLHTTASNYGAVVSSLASLEWLGASSTHMTAAVTPYVQWLHSTANQAQQTAEQAMTAVAAYEAAFAMTVPPEMVTANRSALSALVATNLFGQNTAAIAATEAAYAEMWAQDAAAMNAYATNSAAASQLTAYTPPQPATNPGGPVNAAATAAVPDPPTPPKPGPWEQFFIWLAEHIAGYGDYIGIIDVVAIYWATMSSVNDTISACSSILGDESTLGVLPAAAAEAAEAAAPELAQATTLASRTAMAPGLGGEVAAALRSAGTVGQMSVPAAWAAPATADIKAFSHTPLATLPTSEAVESGMPGMPGMALPGSGRGGVVPRYGIRLTVMGRPLSGG